jgi:hypothetical protein
MRPLVLCLALLTATAGFAQNAEPSPPPLTPADAPPPEAAPAPQGELIPQQQRENHWSAGRFAGQLLLLPPVGVLAGGVGGFAFALPAFIVGFLACEGNGTLGTDSDCINKVTYISAGVGASLGAGLGVMGAGYILGGRARLGAVMAGAMAGSAITVLAVLSTTERDFEGSALYFLAAPVLGATVVYLLSDAFFPDPTRVPASDRKPAHEDEYVRILPMLTPTLTGGVLGGLVGRF